MNKPKIKIIQYMYGNLAYFPLSEWINRRYCERHGYDYVVRHDPPRQDRHIVWHKIPMILDELRDCDYLLFVDADAVFYNHELKIENELIPELQDKIILMAQDCAAETHRWVPGKPNSGVVFAKNTERAREFFVEWNRTTDVDDRVRWQWPPTQRALRQHILPTFKNDMRTAEDYYVVQGHFGQFIRHFALFPEKKRVDAMNDIYKRLSMPDHLNTSSVKPTIKVVQYHWGEQNHSYEINRKINETYCRKHGYDYVCKTFPPRDDRACRWAKIPAMREELHDCDYLLYMDADAFFYSHELKIEEELLPHIKSKQIMMSANCVCDEMRHQPDKPNTGIILVRNTEQTAEMLRVWDESSERPGIEELRFNRHHEQDACFQTIWQEYAADVKLLKEYYLMNGFKGLFIRHLMGRKDEERLIIQREFLENHSDVIQV